MLEVLTNIEHKANAVKDRENKMTELREISFLICNSCFWCATVIHTAASHICHACKSEDVEIIPILSNEKHAYNYNARSSIGVQGKGECA